MLMHVMIINDVQLGTICLIAWNKEKVVVIYKSPCRVTVKGVKSNTKRDVSTGTEVNAK